MGEPDDVDGQCNARLYISDNWGDNHATMRCGLAAGHDGLHKKEYGPTSQTVTISWLRDERQED